MSQQLDQLMDDYDQKRISRRELIALLLSSVAASNTARSQTTGPVSIGRSMNHVSLSVADVNRSADFYQRVLGMEIISRPANGGLNMGLGGESFLGLYEFANPGTMHHLCIGVDNYAADEMALRLQAHGVEGRINRDPANRTSGGDQLYFTDPDGITLQLAQHGYLG